MNQKALIFDFDGTLLDSYLYITLNYLHMFEKFRPDYLPRLEELISFSGPTLKSVFGEYFKDYSYDELYDEFLRYSYSNANKYSSLYPGAKELLVHLHESKVKLALVTSKSRIATTANLEHFEILDCFDVVITANDVERPKPDPSGIIKASKLMNIALKDIIYIGDSVYDMKAARAASVDFRLVNWSFQKEQIFKEDKDVPILHSFKELEAEITEE